MESAIFYAFSWSMIQWLFKWLVIIYCPLSNLYSNNSFSTTNLMIYYQFNLNKQNMVY